MKISRGNILLILAAVLFVGVLIVVTAGSKDSEENQLSRRLDAFVASVPEDVRTSFLDKKYDEAKANLEKFVALAESYTNKFSHEDRIKYLKAEYAVMSNQTALKSVPQDVLVQWQKYYSVIDFECIPQFSPSEVVDFFQEYFVDKLENIRK